MKSYLIRNATIVNEGKIFRSDILVKNGWIEKIQSTINTSENYIEINAEGKLLFPGLIDDQVHFREPGLTYKADIYSESRAGIAGGVTSFMEMPNTTPPALTHELLEDKYRIASQKSLANYSFYLGASNENLDEVLKVNPTEVCGIKIFMGSSTGNLLMDNINALEKIFSQSPLLISTHCEDEATIRKNLEIFKQKFGEYISPECHAEIRNEEACFKSSSFAVELAKKYNTRLNILHISTEKEISLFSNTIQLKDKRITAEVCVHHLWFDKSDYDRLGNKLKCNPSIKEKSNKEALLKGILDDHLDIIASDHAPHTYEEKEKSYLNAPSGLPLIQHTLNIMLEFYRQGKISLEKIVEKMCHSPAIGFQVEKRGFIREGYYADLVLVDLEKAFMVQKSNIFYKCGWSPLEKEQFHSVITHTFVNGILIFENGKFYESQKGMRLKFKR